MSKELPYFKFYASEWLLRAISDESSKIQGDFIRVCAHYWHRKCVLTRSEIERKLTQTSIKVLIEKEFIKEDGFNIIIDFLDEQYAELHAKHKRRVKAGKKGGDAKAGNDPSNATAKGSHLEVDKEVDNINTLVKKVLEHLNKKTEKKNGRGFKAVESNAKFIKARLNEGYKYADLIHVIDVKSDEWMKDGTMKKYLRPETLFNATKFQGYVQQEQQSYVKPHKSEVEQARSNL